MNPNFDNKSKISNYILIIGLSVFIIVTASIFYPYIIDSFDDLIDTKASVGEAIVIEIDDERREAVKFFKDLEIEAKSAIVFDMDSNSDLYEKNTSAMMPLASLVKIVTSYTSLKINDVYARGGEVVLIKIDGQSLLAEGDSGLRLDEEWRMEDLISFMMLESSNDGALALARHFGKKLIDNSLGTNNKTAVTLFVEKMNDLSSSLDLDLEFSNPTGLDGAQGIPGGSGSARDVSRLIAYVIKEYPSVFNNTSKSEVEFVSESGIKHTAINTNTSIASTDNVVASKTGFTEMAGGNLAVSLIEPNGHKIILVVLNSTAEGRFTDMRKLIDATNNYFGKN